VGRSAVVQAHARAPGAPPRPLAGGKAPIRALAAVAAAALAVSALGGCASAPEDELFGMTLQIESSQPWVSDPDFPRRLHVLLQQSCAHVGLDPSMLYGLTLRIVDGGVPCAGIPNARGCTWRAEGVVAVSTLAWVTSEPPVPCVEDTPIPHELLHVAIGDTTHSDPRWTDSGYWDALHAEVTQRDCSGDPGSLLW
jgi:hypothetical protein